MSKYSLCISSLNSANTIHRWASSLLANISDDDEIIIVDGLSTDGSREFLQQLCEANGFTFIAAKTNMGEAREMAFRSSTGEYVIYYLDTDDIVVSLQDVKRLYHAVVEHDPVTGQQRAFRCLGFFIIPRQMLEAVGGYPDLHFYEDQLLAYRLASRHELTASWKVSAVRTGMDPKKRRLRFRVGYSFCRVRDGLRLRMFDTRNLQGILLLPPAWIASLLTSRHEFRKDWWNLDVNRDEHILPWINREHLSHRLLLEEIEKAGLEAVAPPIHAP